MILFTEVATMLFSEKSKVTGDVKIAGKPLPEVLFVGRPAKLRLVDVSLDIKNCLERARLEAQAVCMWREPNAWWCSTVCRSRRLRRPEWRNCAHRALQ
eukprot:scaffold198101_cov16-Prasinocladus_malaysianus.AAC.1